MELEKQKQCNNSNYALLFVAVYCYCCYCCFSCECFFEGIVNVEFGVFEMFLMKCSFAFNSLSASDV